MMSSTTIIPRTRAGQGRYEEQQLFAAWKDGGDESTQAEIAARIGISQMQVSRLLRRSLEQLRSLTHEASSRGM